MARRSVWLVTGIVTGAASSLYAERKLRRTLEAASARLQPDALVTEVGRTARQAARSTGGRVREAVVAGRTEMQRREGEIWAGLGSSGSGPQGSDPRRPGARDTGPQGAERPPGDGSSDQIGHSGPSGDSGAGSDPATPGDGKRSSLHIVRARGLRRGRRSPSHLGK